MDLANKVVLLNSNGFSGKREHFVFLEGCSLVLPKIGKWNWKYKHGFLVYKLIVKLGKDLSNVGGIQALLVYSTKLRYSHL